QLAVELQEENFQAPPWFGKNASAVVSMQSIECEGSVFRRRRAATTAGTRRPRLPPARSNPWPRQVRPRPATPSAFRRAESASSVPPGAAPAMMEVRRSHEAASVAAERHSWRTAALAKQPKGELVVVV